MARRVRKFVAVLALATDAFGGRGGIARYNCDFFSALAGDGSKKWLITVLPRHAPDRVIAPRGIQQVLPRPGRIAYSLTALATALTRRVDILFCGHLYMAPLAVLIARLKGARLVVQTHGIEAWRRPSWLRRAALERADFVLCVSRYTRERVLSWAAIAPERILVLPNTVGDAFTPGDGCALRMALGLEGKRVLLTVGRIDSREQYKGHDRVIAAMPELVAQGYDVAYVIIGEGDDAARLKGLARDSGMTDRLRFMGLLDLETMVEAYRMSDLFVMPSTGEGFGIVFLEAMASGTPALGLAVGGACDALADAMLGTAVKENELSAAIARLLATPGPDPKILSAAVRARFGRDVFTARTRMVCDRRLYAA